MVGWPHLSKLRGTMPKIPLEPIAPHVVPPPSLLVSAWAKYNRAAEHFAELDRFAREVLALTNETNGIQFVESSPGRYKGIVRLPPVPSRLSCSVGDIAHCLRASLDHAAWMMARRHGYAGDPRRVSFPVCKSPSHFQTKWTTRAEVFGASATHRLERLQPYHDRAGLRWLTDLDNVDKHEAIVVVNHRFQTIAVKIRDDRGERELARSADGPSAPVDLQDGDAAFEIAADGPLTDVHVRVQVQNTFALQAAPERAWPADRLDWVVRECFHHVEDVLLDVGGYLEVPPTVDGA